MENKIITNDRFDKLTNLDISIHYRDKEYWLTRSYFMGAFAYWVVVQSPYDTPDIKDALEAFSLYVGKRIGKDMPKKFTYETLLEFINEDVFEGIPEIGKLNHPKIDTGAKYVFVSRDSKPHPDYDFIDTGALARNVFYMILRESITHG